MNKKHVFKESHMFFMAKSVMGFVMSISEAIQCFDWTANDC